MKAVFFSLGSRGDIEPLFALGEILKSQEWDVVYVFPEQFREIVKESNSAFHGFTKEFVELLIAGEQAKELTSRNDSWLKRWKTLYLLAKSSIKINTEVTLRQKEIIAEERPDYVFYNQKCVYPIIWGMKNPGKGIFVHPFPCFLHQVNHHSIIGFGGGGNYGHFLNKLGYTVQSMALSLGAHFSTRKFHKECSGIKINPFSIRKDLLHKVKSLYTISPSLFQQPKYWPKNANVIGYNDRNKSENWSPHEELLAFLKQHEKIIFITFGSISNTNPKEKTEAILSVLTQHKIPAIINTSWGGLVKPSEHPNHVYFVNSIPYDWLLPKIYAVVHHGGSGTTHSALRNGCASLIIPHFIDQFFWNKRNFELGAGPKGMSIKKLNKENFEIKVLDLLENKTYKQNAQAIAETMNRESNVDQLMDFILK